MVLVLPHFTLLSIDLIALEVICIYIIAELLSFCGFRGKHRPAISIAGSFFYWEVWEKIYGINGIDAMNLSLPLIP
jgi:hypothetical protein